MPKSVQEIFARCPDLEEHLSLWAITYLLSDRERLHQAADIQLLDGLRAVLIQVRKRFAEDERNGEDHE